MAELGILISQETREYLMNDWKMSLSGIKSKMCASEEYKKLEKKRKTDFLKLTKQYANKRNIIVICIYVLGFVFMLWGAKKLDSIYDTTKWTERVYTIVISGIIVPLIIAGTKLFKKSK